jgi:hypothetical protein
MNTQLKLLNILLTAAFVSGAHASNHLSATAAAGELIPQTGHTSNVTDWRFTRGQVFNGVAGALDGVARLEYSNSGGNWACSGSLLAGGAYVLTAAHCADNYTSMTVKFGVDNGSASVVRNVALGAATIHSGWNGTLDTGADIAILKLDQKVTGIAGYKISTTNDVGKEFLMAGYGTTQIATTNAPTNWNDWKYGHFGFNTFDVQSNDLNKAIGDVRSNWYNPADYAYGATYVSDFDSGSAAHNTLGRVASATGGTWGNTLGLGARESLIAGGDSGGGDFVWNGSEWLLSGVHSWGWGGQNPCLAAYVADYLTCDNAPQNGSSYGDLSGSTATFSHAAWIASVTAVPEPESYAMLLAGLLTLGSVVRRRKQGA